MGNILNINTSTIQSIASNVADKNADLYAFLERSRASMQSLAGIWTGKAGSAMTGAYSAFASGNFENYHQMLEEYVIFLRDISAPGYEKAEEIIADKSAEI